jgi:hypothetical protein
MRPYVAPGSIVRSIWGDADTILLAFAGSAAEFALNRAVDWLFYTGKLPADPLGRLFSTARFAQDIAFADEATARRSLGRIRAAHQAVERSRGQAIPDLPETYDAWREDRRVHLERDLIHSDLTAELYRRYRHHLGRWRYETLLRVQGILVPDHVRRLLGLGPCRWLRPSLRAYRAVVRIGLRPLVHRLVMPPAVLPQIRRLDFAG